MGCRDGPGGSCSKGKLHDFIAERGESFGDYNKACGVNDLPLVNLRGMSRTGLSLHDRKTERAQWTHERVISLGGKGMIQLKTARSKGKESEAYLAGSSLRSPD